MYQCIMKCTVCGSYITVICLSCLACPAFKAWVAFAWCNFLDRQHKAWNDFIVQQRARSGNMQDSNATPGTSTTYCVFTPIAVRA